MPSRLASSVPSKRACSVGSAAFDGIARSIIRFKKLNQMAFIPMRGAHLTEIMIDFHVAIMVPSEMLMVIPKMVRPRHRHL
jgi:hypothetical protein